MISKKVFLISIISLFISSVSFNQSQAVIQKTFGMIKPSGMEKQKEIKSIIASHNLKIIKEKKMIMTDKMIDKLYVMHKNKPFYQELKASLLNKEVIAMVIYGNNAVEEYRLAVADIREKYALNKTENAVHGSDSWYRGHEEINMFFPKKAVVKKEQQSADIVKTSVESEENKVEKR